MSLANFSVCAESAYYATHPNNHIYVIDLVRLSRGKNSKECYIIETECYNWQWTNVIPLLQTKTADTAHREYLQVTPGPFPDFWVGPGDEARV